MVSAHPIYHTEAITKALAAEGYALVANAILPEQCTTAREMIDRLAPIGWDVAHDCNSANPTYVDRYLCVFNRDPYWLSFLDRPGIIAAVEAALGSDCHIIGMTAWRSHPGYHAEPLHTDYVPFEVPRDTPLAYAAPVFILTVHFYLSDTSVDLAPTRIVAGSHRTGRAPSAAETLDLGRDAEPVLASAGDALLFRSDVWHSGSDNRTAHEVRYLLQVHYGRRQIAQHFSPFMSWRFNSDVLAAASRRQRRLLGDHEPGAYD